MDYILSRRSVRNFDTTRKLTFEQLKELCRYGESAPTARNQKSREYIIIDDENVIMELSKISKGALVLSKCNTAIAVIARKREEMITPHMVDQDLSCAVENILLAATAQNIGSCYIGVYPIEERVTASDEVLGLCDGKHTFALIALGYPNDNECFYVKEKLDDSMIHHNRY